MSSSHNSRVALSSATSVAAASRPTPERLRDRALVLTVDFLWRLAQQQDDKLNAGSERGERSQTPTPSQTLMIKKLNLHLTDVRLGKVHDIRNVSSSLLSPSLSPSGSFANRHQKLDRFPNLCELNLSYNALTIVQGLETLENLHTLNLAENRVQKVVSLPRGIRRLNLSGNELTTIPEAVSSCENIQILRLARNRVADLSEIFKLDGRFNLHSLNMSHNPVAALPQYFSFCICVCRGLDMLDGSSVTEGTRQSALQRYGGELQSE